MNRQARRGPNDKVHQLKVYQVNVARTNAIHHTALEDAYKQRADLILVQEPHCGEISSTKTQYVLTHGGYDLHSPVTEWTHNPETHPRVHIYTRKGLPPVELVDLTVSRDILIIEISECNITIANIYRKSGDLTALRALEDWEPPVNTLIAGDFNAHHSH
jgi:hypothetical protein